MIQILNLGVSVSFDFTYYNLPVIHKLIHNKQLYHVLHNYDNTIIDLDNFVDIIDILALGEPNNFENVCKMNSVEQIKTIHFVYKIISFIQEHQGSVFDNCELSVDKNISKLKHGKRIFREVGIVKHHIKIGYIFSNYTQ
jgi:hypothetical protein